MEHKENKERRSRSKIVGYDEWSVVDPQNNVRSYKLPHHPDFLHHHLHHERKGNWQGERDMRSSHIQLVHQCGNFQAPQNISCRTADTVIRCPLII